MVILLYINIANFEQLRPVYFYGDICLWDCMSGSFMVPTNCTGAGLSSKTQTITVRDLQLRTFSPNEKVHMYTHHEMSPLSGCRPSSLLTPPPISSIKGRRDVTHWCWQHLFRCLDDIVTSLTGWWQL